MWGFLAAQVGGAMRNDLRQSARAEAQFRMAAERGRAIQAETGVMFGSFAITDDHPGAAAQLVMGAARNDTTFHRGFRQF